MDFDAEIAKLHEANNNADTPPEEAPAAPPAPETQAAPAATPTPAAPRTYSLDDLLPDAEDIPPSFRGKPFRALLDDRRTVITQRDEIGRVKNDHESENRVLKSLLQVLIEQNQGGRAATPEAPAPESMEDRVRRERLDALMPSDASMALGRTLEIAQETILPQVKGQLEPIDARLQRLEQQDAARRTYEAHTLAGARLGRDMKDWKGEAETNAISAAVLALQLPVDQPESYVKASEWLDNLVTIRAPKTQAGSAPAPAAQAAPAAPAPPAGGGAPAAPSETTTPALDARDADTLARMRKTFEEATGRKMPKETWEATYQRVAATAPRRRRA